MRTPLLLALATTFALTACGGGGGTSGGGNNPVPNPPSGGNVSSQSQSETAITVANSLGDPVKNITNFNSTVSGASMVMRRGQLVAMAGSSGQCNSGSEFFAPDKNNDPNSTEEQYFYDSGCTELARDIVRIFNVSGTSETVNRTEKQYAINNATPTAQRTTMVSFINGSYNANGFPNVANGFDRSATSELDISGSKTMLNDDELVMTAGSNGVNAYCSDAAGYNATGIASLNETFGNQGGASSGTRTVNSDGSVTWQSTNSGTAYKGAIGSFAINIGAANTACPIATPEYSLSGGTATGTYSIPVTVTFNHGLLTNLTVTNAQLANGNTLNVTTNSGVQPQNSQFITGTVSNNGTQISTFAVDAFGDGTLTVTSSGAQYVMSDWHVVK
ncbi:MAG: hypothetical protein JO322_07470 [Candidatus Eremiobacteraeota bacterium]|nr:hypothetical protein [Candidatus Eremiobacteraeota bacterium]